MQKKIVLYLLIIVLFVFGIFLLINNKKDKPLGILEEQKILLDNVDYNKDMNNNTNTTKVEENTLVKEDENLLNIKTATLKTNKGDIVIEFFSKDTPNTVKNFVKLSKEGFYNGTKFHRVIKNFMNQGGDPLSKDDTKMNYWGTGGPGYKFEDEIKSSNKNDAYTIAMANSGPNTNGSQFFINVVNNNYLDSKHTVFGRVVSGKDVVDIINSVPTLPNDRPVESIVIENIILN